MFAQEMIAERCDYTQLPNGVHKFVFNESSPEAVDEWFGLMENVYRNSLPGQCIRILVDSSEIDVQPINYVSQRGRELNHNFPQRVSVSHELSGFPGAHLHHHGFACRCRSGSVFPRHEPRK